MLQIIDAIRIYEKSLGNKENIFTGALLSENERTYIASNCNAFLIGLISDQSVKAETAWSLPYKLSKRLDISDPNEIAETYSMEEVKAAIPETLPDIYGLHPRSCVRNMMGKPQIYGKKLRLPK